MKSLFDSADRASILERLDSLGPDAVRQWGKMNPAQMLTHCSRALEVATGERPMKHSLIGKVLSPFVRSSALGEKPFGHDSPTDPAFVVGDEHEFSAEKARLVEVIDQFAALGPEQTSGVMHSFFGRLSGDEWGRLMYKHLDHHLRQFGV